MVRDCNFSGEKVEACWQTRQVGIEERADLDEGDTQIQVGCITQPKCKREEASNWDYCFQVGVAREIGRGNHARPDLLRCKTQGQSSSLALT